MTINKRAYCYAVGDLKPDIVQIIKQRDGTVVDLTSAISVTFSMRNMDTDTTAIDEASATITDATAGEVTYTLQSGDMDTEGRYIGYFIVYWGAASSTPQSPTGIEITVKQPWERLS